MISLTFALAALGGGVGAMLRYLTDVAVSRLVGRRFPWAVFAVNIVGSFLLGILVGALPVVVFVVGAGVLGGFTTFSTAMVDSVALWRDGRRPAAVLNAAGMLVAGLIAAALGVALGMAL